MDRMMPSEVPTVVLPPSPMAGWADGRWEYRPAPLEGWIPAPSRAEAEERLRSLGGGMLRYVEVRTFVRVEEPVVCEEPVACE